jgi:hypothetical protein
VESISYPNDSLQQLAGIPALQKIAIQFCDRHDGESILALQDCFSHYKQNSIVKINDFSSKQIIILISQLKKKYCKWVNMHFDRQDFLTPDDNCSLSKK